MVNYYLKYYNSNNEIEFEITKWKSKRIFYFNGKVKYEGEYLNWKKTWKRKRKLL